MLYKINTFHNKCLYFIIIGMFISKTYWTNRSGKTYQSIWLKESCRVNGKVKSRYILNLKDWPDQVVNALDAALKACSKSNAASLNNNTPDKPSLMQLDPKSISLKQGLSVGALFTVHQTAVRLGIVEALGNDLNAKLALWQIYARVLEQGSRLSAVRMANLHAVISILGFNEAFTENDLYKNLKWLDKNQKSIEDKLYTIRYHQKGTAPNLFLYDVTSSYLEGEKNELAQFGYNRDKKKGKLQIVIGLLCDNEGIPVSIEVFEGNTQDPKTVLSQIQKVRDRFGCEKVTFVGDRGMLKSVQLENLKEAGFAYITAITQPQIKTLLKAGVLEYSLFDEMLFETESAGIRYIYRRNPVRAVQIQATRDSKLKKIKELLAHKNVYLSEHPKAQVKAALKRIGERIGQLKCTQWIKVAETQEKARVLELSIDEKSLESQKLLDGCYVLKTDVPKELSPKEEIHERYKDLSMVERAFRTCKTVSLELRPLHVRLSASTRGHVFVVMLAYMILQELNKAWSGMEITVEEGLNHLTTLTEDKIMFPDGSKISSIPAPNEQNEKLLKAAGVILPPFMLSNDISVVTYSHKKKDA
jgi:transposase